MRESGVVECEQKSVENEGDLGSAGRRAAEGFFVLVEEFCSNRTGCYFLWLS